MCYVFLMSVFACATKKILRCTRRALAGCMLRTHHSLRNVSPHRVLIKRYTTEIQVDTQSQEAATFLFLPAPRILHLSPSSPPRACCLSRHPLGRGVRRGEQSAVRSRTRGQPSSHLHAPLTLHPKP